MNNLNSLIIEGNVVKQGNLVEPVSGFKKCIFPIAVNRWYRNKEGNGVTDVSFFDIETYGKMAEICEKQSTKGRGIRVVGRLKQDRWNDSDGKIHSRIYVVAEHIEYKPKIKGEESAVTDAENSPTAAITAEAVCVPEQTSADVTEDSVF